jgi:hypothetical protein
MVRFDYGPFWLWDETSCSPLWPSRLQTKSKIMQCLPNNITNNNELYESVDHSNFLTTNMNYSWGVILETYRYCWLKNATTSHVRTFLFTTSQSHDRFHSEVHFYRKFCAGKIWNIFTSFDTGSSLNMVLFWQLFYLFCSCI